MTLRRTTALFLPLLFLASCSDGPDWFGASDKPVPPPLVEDVLCDPSAGSTCSEAALREVLGVALGQAAERPGSMVRLWVQGRDIETTRMVGEARSVKPRGSGRRARQEHESRWIAEEQRLLMTAAQPSLRLHPRRSPIAEAIGRVALAASPMKEQRMSYEHLFEYMALGGAGALFMELVKAWELKGKLGSAEVIAMLKDPIVLLTGLGFVIGSGFLAWAVNASGVNQLLPVIASGIGARSIARGFLEARGAQGDPRLSTKTNLKKWFS